MQSTALYQKIPWVCAMAQMMSIHQGRAVELGFPYLRKLQKIKLLLPLR